MNTFLKATQSYIVELSGIDNFVSNFVADILVRYLFLLLIWTLFYIISQKHRIVIVEGIKIISIVGILSVIFVVIANSILALENWQLYSALATVLMVLAQPVKRLFEFRMG